MERSACFDVFEHCAGAMSNGDLIESVSDRDKEFHFQNWFQSRLEASGLFYEPPSRNVYPDFRMVNSAEGFEVKALAWPGRDRNLDRPVDHDTGPGINAATVDTNLPADRIGQSLRPDLVGNVHDVDLLRHLKQRGIGLFSQYSGYGGIHRDRTIAPHLHVGCNPVTRAQRAGRQTHHRNGVGLLQ